MKKEPTFREIIMKAIIRSLMNRHFVLFSEVCQEWGRHIHRNPTKRKLMETGEGEIRADGCKFFDENGKEVSMVGSVREGEV